MTSAGGRAAKSGAGTCTLAVRGIAPRRHPRLGRLTSGSACTGSRKPPSGERTALDKFHARETLETRVQASALA